MRVDINRDIFDKLNLFVAQLNIISNRKIYLYEIVEKALIEYLKKHRGDV